MENIGAKDDLNYADLVQEVSGKNVAMQTRDCFCNSLVKNAGAFPNSLTQAKLERFRLTALIKEISKHPDTNFVLQLLKFTLMKNILMTRSKLRKEKFKIYGSKNKGPPGSRMELKPAFREINRLRGW